MMALSNYKGPFILDLDDVAKYREFLSAHLQKDNISKGISRKK